MRRVSRLLSLGLLTTLALAASKPHVVSFGKWTQVKCFVGDDESRPVDLKIRPLYVDTRLKEFTLGAAHEVTDRIFVVRRAFRLNDALPDEPAILPKWTWQRGGWLMVDRVSGRVSPLSLPECDVQYSTASWYRDYVAYCGVSSDGRKAFGIVAQLGRRKPILKKPLAEAAVSADSESPAPQWQRQPPRVTFVSGDAKATYAIHGTIVDLVTDDDEDEASSESR